jgi:hypothetical protein
MDLPPSYRPMCERFVGKFPLSFFCFLAFSFSLSF